MDDKHSTYPKDLPWQELKAKVHVDETIFQNKGINVKEDDAKDQIRSGSKSNQSSEDAESKQTKIKKPVTEARPLPHQQVPQPQDFSTKALEQL